MNLAAIDRRLLSHPEATKAFHKKWGWMVYWVGGRQFACEFMASTASSPPIYDDGQLACSFPMSQIHIWQSNSAKYDNIGRNTLPI